MDGSSGAEVALPLSSSTPSYGAHVSYSCDSCGYELNLNSCNRSIEYDKSKKRGVISFFSIDETRFMQTRNIRWLPWKLFQPRTKLLCRSCGNYIGNVGDGGASSSSSSSAPLFRLNSATWDGISGGRMYKVKIRSLRPLSFEGSTFLI